MPDIRKLQQVDSGAQSKTISTLSSLAMSCSFVCRKDQPFSVRIY